MQEIQFLEFMGGSNLPQAFPNYFICLCFIRISTVSLLLHIHGGHHFWTAVSYKSHVKGQTCAQGLHVRT